MFWVAFPIALVSPPCMAESGGTLPPVAAFGSLPKISDVALSPNGKSLAWVDAGSFPAHIVIVDVVNNKVRQAISAGTAKVRGLVWADEDTLLYEASITRPDPSSLHLKYETYRFFSVDFVAGKTHALLNDDPSFENVTSLTLLAAHTSKAKTALVSTLSYDFTGYRMESNTHIKRDRALSAWLNTVFEVDTQTGKSKKIGFGTPFTKEWVLDADGKVLARSEWQQKTQEFSILAKRGLGWVKIYQRNDGNQLELHGLTSGRDAIITTGLDTDGRSKLLAIPLDGSNPRILYEDPNQGVVGIRLDRFNGRPIAVYLDGVNTALQWIDPKLQAFAKSFAASFPERLVEILEYAADNSRVVFRVSAPDKPETYYLFDAISHKADIIGEAYPALANVKLGKVIATSYAARDGQQIPAYLTFPPGYSSEKPLPMVVMPHGGPAARDYFAFDYLSQFVASRGYLVLRPQFRGSTGFGEQFRMAGVHQWGGLMQDDVTDGVMAMIAKDLADPHRICIVGWSYGGYAALAGAAFTPGLYACAISINGVFDLPLMLAYQDEHGGKESDSALYWREYMGSNLDPRLGEVSPNRHVDSVRANVLLIQATDDTVVPSEQADTMAKALRAGSKPVTLVKIPGDDHWLSSAQSRVQALAQVDNFLRSNLPN